MESQDSSARSERELLLAYVRAAREAISELRPAEMRAKRLPSAMNEIGMIIETTESAANQIMDAASAILELPPELTQDSYRAEVEQRCLSMMGACSFQDLTGQRSTKIIEMLLHIEDKLGRLAHLLSEDEHAEEVAADVEPPSGDVLLNGPAMPGEGVDQDDIDRMFAAG